jgi:hypothetical protein
MDDAYKKCRNEWNSCKTDEEQVKWSDRYGVYKGTAMYNCIKDKTGNPNIWEDMTKACGKCGFLKGIRFWKTPIPRLL